MEEIVPSRTAAESAREEFAARDPLIIESADLRLLFQTLRQQDFHLIGPTVVEQAIVYNEIESIDDLPVGWTDEQQAGTYRLKRRDDNAFFGFVVGPQSWKKHLFPPSLKLWEARQNGAGLLQIETELEEPRFAFIGVRACELRAIGIQDRVFAGGEFPEPTYQRRRENAFVVAVNCGQAGGTCFCVSMNTGPRATDGFDLALTEVLDGEEHYFVVEVGTGLGAEVMAEVPYARADASDLQKVDEVVACAAKQMGRSMETDGIKELLYRNYENSRWDEVASRCLSCANCTMVCPTCFCHTVEDVTDLTGAQAERWRRWDSCFTADFSYIHGGNVRPSARSRYRQWLIHKLGAWIDQFGTSGCVGCGRCITWCPVGIDLTEEVRAIRRIEADDPSSLPKEANHDS